LPDLVGGATELGSLNAAAAHQVMSTIITGMQSNAGLWIPKSASNDSEERDLQIDMINNYLRIKYERFFNHHELEEFNALPAGIAHHFLWHLQKTLLN
jgi:hypothetical protein